jgi:hypothetical protein
MAVCSWCEREMTTAPSCTATVLHREGFPIRMIPWGKERGWRGRGRCGDCGVNPRGFHHLGCDVQRCPLCEGQMISCGCRFDEDGPDDDEEEVIDLYVDSNGDPAERRVVGDQEVVIHYGDLPESDVTTVHGIPCTTALRTVIDVAPDVSAEHLDRIVKDCLQRRLFTLDEARERLARPDMLKRPGAVLLREVLSDL